MGIIPSYPGPAPQGLGQAASTPCTRPKRHRQPGADLLCAMLGAMLCGSVFSSLPSAWAQPSATWDATQAGLAAACEDTPPPSPAPWSAPKTDADNASPAEPLATPADPASVPEDPQPVAPEDAETAPEPPPPDLPLPEPPTPPPWRSPVDEVLPEGIDLGATPPPVPEDPATRLRRKRQQGNPDPIPTDPAWRLDPRGRAYRASFDQGNLLTFGLGMERDLDGPLETSLQLGARLRSPRAGVTPEDESYWISDARVLDTTLYGLSSALGRMPAVKATAVEGAWLRYSRDPFLTVPSVPPRRVWFPFNTGLSVRALALDTFSPPKGYVGSLEVVESQLLLDFMRSPRASTWGRLGVGIRYDLLLPEQEDLELGGVVSLFAPFSAVSLALHHEWPNGLTSLDFRLDWVHRGFRTTDWTTLTDGSLRLDRVLLSVQDQPILLYVGARVRQDTLEAQAPWQVSLLAGLTLGLNR